MTTNRKNELFNEMLDWIIYHCPTRKDLYLTLTNTIGMTDDEIKELNIEDVYEYTKCQDEDIWL